MHQTALEQIPIDRATFANKGEGEGPNSLIRTRRISCWERRG